ncbi:MAG: Rpn family recombination-promoting nuclease/putative transposase [Pseudomonadota bacterium]
MTEITKPHDLFFKAVFSRPDVAETFVLNFLPPNVTAHFKPKSFRLCQGSFVDERLKEYHSDLLYQVDFKDGRGAYVYLLFEHKSSPERTVAYQILRYLMRI